MSARFLLSRTRRPFHRLLLLALLAAPLALVAPGPPASAVTAAAGCEPNAILVNPCRPWLGAYPARYPTTGATGLAAQVAAHEQRIGRQLDIVHSYHSVGTNTLTADEQSLAKRPGTALYLNWKPSATWGPATGGDATVNAAIDAQARSIASLGSTKVFLALFHEPENDVTSGGDGCTGVKYVGSAGTPADYKAMWRNVRTRFDALGATNVVWVVNYMSYEPWRCLVDDLYPGDDLVDWIFYDSYGAGAGANFRNTMARMYDYFTSTSDATHDYLSKPWGLAEWNTDSPTVADEADFYVQAKAAVEGNLLPRLKALLTYDTIAPEGGDFRTAYFDLGYNSVKDTQYAAYATSPAFVDVPPPPPDTTAPTAQVTAPTGDQPVGGRVTVKASMADDRGVTGAWLEVDGVLTGDVAHPTTGMAEFPLDTRTLADGPHVLAVGAEDAAGNSATSPGVTVQVDNTVATPPADTTAPSVPASVTTSRTGASVAVSWAASTDATGVTGYEVSRDGALVATVEGTTYTDAGLPPGSYTFTVRALDASGNLSDPSAGATVAVPDVTAPTTPGGVITTVAGSRVTLSWPASVDDVAVTGYRVLRDRVQIGGPSVPTFTDTTSQQGRTYVYTVVAVDAAGNASPAADPLSQFVPDVTAPGRPATPTVKVTPARTLAVTWPVPTDNVGIGRYEVWRDNVLVGEPTSAAFTDATVQAGRPYTYRVVGVDTSGNRGASSASSAPVTVPSTDVTAPSRPTLTATSTVARTVVLRWTASTDNVGVTGYRVYRGATQIATVGGVLTYTVKNLTSGSSLKFGVQAVDAAGNRSAQSALVAVKVR